MRRLSIFLALISVCGCRRDDQIQTYRASKEVESPSGMSAGMAMNNSPAPKTEAPELPPGHPDVSGGTGSPAATDMQAMGAGMTAEGSAKEIDWKVPAGWSEQPPSSMRVGSFLIKGANGQTADVSVIPLSGEAGGDLANINRWRGQINLGPISQADLSAQSETISPAGRKMLYINFVSADLLLEHRYKKRLVAAIYHRGDRTWFFKMVGEDATVLSAKPAFVQFLKSLQFHDR